MGDQGVRSRRSRLGIYNYLLHRTLANWFRRGRACVLIVLCPCIGLLSFLHHMCVNVGFSCVPCVIPMRVLPVLGLFLCNDVHLIGRSATASVVEGLLR